LYSTQSLRIHANHHVAVSCGPIMVFFFFERRWKWKLSGVKPTSNLEGIHMGYSQTGGPCQHGGGPHTWLYYRVASCISNTSTHVLRVIFFRLLSNHSHARPLVLIWPGFHFLDFFIFYLVFEAHISLKKIEY